MERGCVVWSEIHRRHGTASPEEWAPREVPEKDGRDDCVSVLRLSPLGPIHGYLRHASMFAPLHSVALFGSVVLRMLAP